MPTKIRIDIVPSFAALMLIAALLAVLVLDDVLEAVVLLEVPVTVPVVFVPLSVLSRTESVVNEAVKPETFVQALFGVPVPETKLTAEHCKRHQR